MRTLDDGSEPDMDGLFRRLIAERSGVERLRMASDMFDAARRLIVASLPRDVADEAAERRVAVFERTYWGDREDAFVAAVIVLLRAQVRPPRT